MCWSNLFCWCYVRVQYRPLTAHVRAPWRQRSSYRKENINYQGQIRYAINHGTKLVTSYDKFNYRLRTLTFLKYLRALRACSIPWIWWSRFFVQHLDLGWPKLIHKPINKLCITSHNTTPKIRYHFHHFCIMILNKINAICSLLQIS